MKKFKNLFLVLIMAFALVGFTACDDPSDDHTTHVDSNNDGKCDECGVNVDKNDDGDGEDEVKYNFLGAEFIIQVDNRASSDPRSDSYTGLFQSEKVALIKAAEEKYNVKITYINYPASASWGGARERHIVQNNISGTPTAHIYQIPSYSIGTLASQNALSPLDTYIEEFGNDAIWDESLLYSTAMGQVYGYSDIYSLANEGIFYNSDLLAKYLGEENATKPSDMWQEGTWTWEAFDALCRQLDELVAADEYVLGGRAYNWAYQMLGANGVHLVDTDLQVGLDSEAGIETITKMNQLFNSVKWDYESAKLSDATSTEMVKGKVVFHNGQTYWINNKWNSEEYAPFDFGFVPYPVGSNVEDDLSNYYINDVYGKAQYVISSTYAKSLVNPGYENITLHDEVIFKIWNDIQYFPEKDPATGKASLEEYIGEYVNKDLNFLYADEVSIEAHMSIMSKAYPDYFYSLDEAKGHVEGSFMLLIQAAVLGDVNNIRASMTSLAQQVKTAFIAKYNLPNDYYG